MKSPWRSDPSDRLRHEPEGLAMDEPGTSLLSPFALTWPGESSKVADDFFEGAPENIVLDATSATITLDVPEASLYVATGGQSFMLVIGE